MLWRSFLQERCGEVQTETFMSDDTDAYYNTWVSTFSGPGWKLLCSWHVRQRESIKRHKQGESVKKEAVHKKDKNFWNVQSASNKQTVHHVRRISSGCSCLLNCPSCDACVHTFECSCADYSIRVVLCYHIHSVNILYPKTTAADLEFPGTELETTSDSDREETRGVV